MDRYRASNHSEAQIITLRILMYGTVEYALAVKSIGEFEGEYPNTRRGLEDHLACVEA